MHIIHLYGHITRMHGATKWLLSFASELKNIGHKSNVLCTEFRIQKPYWLTAKVNAISQSEKHPQTASRNRILQLIRNYIHTIQLIKYIPKDAEAIVLHAEGTVLLIPFVKWRRPQALIIYYCYQPPRELYDLWPIIKQDLSMTTRLVVQLLMPIYKWLDKCFVRATDFVLVWSGEYENYARAIYGDIQYRRIPAGVNFEMFTDNHRQEKIITSIRNRKLTILMNATLTRKKNIDLFVSLVARLREQKIDVQGIVIGEGPLENELCDLAKKLGVENHFRIIGFVSQEDLPQYYHAADLLIYLEPNGAWSMSIIEAGAAHIPVVVAPGGSMQTLVRHEATGFVLNDEKDLKATGKIIEKLLADSMLRKKMGEANFKHCQQFSLETSAKKFLEVLHEKEAHA